MKISDCLSVCLTCASSQETPTLHSLWRSGHTRRGPQVHKAR